tara:strand:- start:1401 stop:1979 length:579 start_codon:yes stop_codon:yes gene_type:complete
MSQGLDLVLNNPNNAMLDLAEMRGETLVKNNDFFKDLSYLMSDEKFSNFFDKYFKNMEDIKSTVIYMKLYRLFQERYKELSNDELSKYVNIYLLHNIMSNKNLRKTIIQETINHLQDNREPIMNLTPNIEKRKKKNKKIKKRMERFMKKIENELGNNNDDKNNNYENGNKNNNDDNGYKNNKYNDNIGYNSI